MKMAVIAITENGALLAQKIINKFASDNINLYLPADRAKPAYRAGYYHGSLSQQMATLWQEYDGIICVMALGIVIRMIAPHVKDKRQDPAIIVLDEKGQFVISALSGHWGGANELANKIAKTIGAQTVITTATDVNNLPAIEMVAKKMGLYIENFSSVKTINSALVNEDKLSIYSDIPLEVKWPRYVEIFGMNSFSNKGTEAKVVITNKIITTTDGTLILRPRNLIVGIGCRRGIAAAKVLEGIKLAMKEAGYSINSVKNLASIDIKKDEEGLLQAAQELSLPVHFFAQEDINQLYESEAGKELSFSDFVHDKLGVGGVCEAVTLLSSQEARLVLPKMKVEGVTVAIAEENWL